MTLTYSVIFWIFLKTSCCQLHCVTKTPDDREFSINVSGHIEVESRSCFSIPYEITFPTNKVTVPYKKRWFNGDPSNIVTTATVIRVESETKSTVWMDGLSRGEYEYGFKLEWGCNQTYVFPKRVHISVSALTQKPSVRVPPMEEGQRATLSCRAYRPCSSRQRIHWTRKKADGQPALLHHDYVYWSSRGQSVLHLTPTADDHNTNITCVAEYDYDVVETTVTLSVKFPPKILNGSQCVVEGKLLLCVCLSRGNPLPPITWPLATLTDYALSSSSSIQTVNSTITMSVARYHNTTVKCISSNELGQAQTEIPLHNYTGNSRLNNGLVWKQTFDGVFPWIIVSASLSLNQVLFATFINCTCKRSKDQQKERCQEMNTYASLNTADVGPLYSVISSRNK